MDKYEWDINDRSIPFRKEVKDGKITLTLINPDEFGRHLWAYRFSSIGRTKMSIFFFVGYFLLISLIISQATPLQKTTFKLKSSKYQQISIKKHN